VTIVSALSRLSATAPQELKKDPALRDLLDRAFKEARQVSRASTKPLLRAQSSLEEILVLSRKSKKSAPLLKRFAGLLKKLGSLK
jgi:hypothetical protein